MIRGEAKVTPRLVGASRDPSHINLGALIRICGPWCRNVTIFFNFYV